MREWQTIFNVSIFKVTESTDFTELTNREPWLSTTKLVVKPDMLFGKRGLVALNLDMTQVAKFVKERLGVEVIPEFNITWRCPFQLIYYGSLYIEIGYSLGWDGWMQGTNNHIHCWTIFVPHHQEYYLSIVSERLDSTISFSKCGGIEIEENWDKVYWEIKLCTCSSLSSLPPKL